MTAAGFEPETFRLESKRSIQSAMECSQVLLHLPNNLKVPSSRPDSVKYFFFSN